LSDQHESTFWRERAEQLQTALDTRVVIEQAKGILGERFGLGIEGAFGLLRHAARRRRMKLHTLAQEVVDRRDTPEPIVESLALHVETFVAVPRDERVERTKVLYAQLNRKIAALLDDGSRVFLCECGNPLCNEPIELDGDELPVLHSKDGFFAIMPGHQIPDLETVIRETPRYALVRHGLSSAA
jgi:predicted DNA-binding ribbon-helix-helix protein